MEQNLPIITKKLWNMVRLAFFMVRKGICKKKILLDLNLMMKRAKITGKASATRAGIASHLKYATSDGPREYEFSCNKTPLYRQYFTNKRKNHDNFHQKYDHYMMSSSPSFEDTSDNLEAINQVLESTLSNKNRCARQLRITDSPFPLQNKDDKCDQLVDEAADEFIKKFYSQLKKQNC